MATQNSGNRTKFLAMSFQCPPLCHCLSLTPVSAQPRDSRSSGGPSRRTPRTTLCPQTGSGNTGARGALSAEDCASSLKHAISGKLPPRPTQLSVGPEALDAKFLSLLRSSQSGHPQLVSVLSLRCSLSYYTPVHTQLPGKEGGRRGGRSPGLQIAVGGSLGQTALPTLPTWAGECPLQLRGLPSMSHQGPNSM